MIGVAGAPCRKNCAVVAASSGARVFGGTNGPCSQLIVSQHRPGVVGCAAGRSDGERRADGRARRYDTAAGARRDGAGRRHFADHRFGGRLLLGRAGCFEHTKGVTQALSGYSGGKKETRITRSSARTDWPRRVGRGDLRPKTDFLRQDFADLFFSCAQPDRVELSRSRRGPATARPSFMLTTSRNASPRPISPSSIRPAFFQARL